MTLHTWRSVRRKQDIRNCWGIAKLCLELQRFRDRDTSSLQIMETMGLTKITKIPESLRDFVEWLEGRPLILQRVLSNAILFPNPTQPKLIKTFDPSKLLPRCLWFRRKLFYCEASWRRKCQCSDLWPLILMSCSIAIDSYVYTDDRYLVLWKRSHENHYFIC